MERRQEQKDSLAASSRPSASHSLRSRESTAKATFIDRRRRKRPERWASAFLLAAVLHGLLLLLADRLVPTGEDFLEPTILITLKPDLPVSSLPAPHATPPGEAPVRPLPSVPPKERLETPETGEDQPPLRPRALKHPQTSKSPTPKEDSPVTGRGDSVHLRQPPASDAAAASAQPEKVEKQPERNRPPSAVHHPPPEYPQRARARGWQGTVIVEVLVDPAGRVSEARLVATSGHEVLDRAALEEVQNWRFRPGQQDGKNSAMRVRIPIRFQLKESKRLRNAIFK